MIKFVTNGRIKMNRLQLELNLSLLYRAIVYYSSNNHVVQVAYY